MYRSTASRMNSLLDFPCCFIASSTRTAISGGNEKVMVFVVRGMITSCYQVLLKYSGIVGAVSIASEGGPAGSGALDRRHGTPEGTHHVRLKESRRCCRTQRPDPVVARGKPVMSPPRLSFIPNRLCITCRST